MDLLRKNYPHGRLIVSITVAVIFSLTFPPKSVGLKVLGSRPPGCVNKCLSCRPCMATLVIPSHQRRSNFRASKFHGEEDDHDDSYYLLSWKCKCGDKLFQP